MTESRKCGKGTNMYIAKTKTETITENKILQAEDFGGWSAINLGTTTAVINGTPYDPAGSVVGEDHTDLRPEVIWGEPIRITFTGAGTNLVVVKRIKYTKQ